MIRPLKSLKKKSQVTPASAGRTGHKAQQFRRFQMMRAGTAHKQPTRAHQIKTQFVDAAVGFQSLFCILATLDEGRRIKADNIETSFFPAQIGKQGQRIALQCFRVVQSGLRRVAACEFQRRCRRIKKGDALCAPCGSQRAETACIAESVQNIRPSGQCGQ